MGSPQSFDIIYALVAFAPPLNCHVVAREVEALDRTHALLSWVRKHIGLAIEPLEMFEEPYTHDEPCGCHFYLQFKTERLGRLEKLRTGEQAVPTLEIECEACEAHEPSYADVPEPDERDWNGTVAAWAHDPHRPATFVRD